MAKEARMAAPRQALIEELRSSRALKGLASAAVAEFFCVAIFVFLAVAIVTTGCHTPDTARASGASNSTLAAVPPGACFLGTENVLNTSLGFGLSICITVYAATSFSGGQIQQLEHCRACFE